MKKFYQQLNSKFLHSNLDSSDLGMFKNRVENDVILNFPAIDFLIICKMVIEWALGIL